MDALILSDPRVIYLGWKDSKELLQYLCAADLYCQPGSASVTLQNAICCHCPIMSYMHEWYKNIDCNNFLWIETEKDMENVFKDISKGRIDLNIYRENTDKCAEEFLDYKKIARRIYNF